MQRRQVLKAVAASGAIGIGAETVASMQNNGSTETDRTADIEQYDSLRIVSDGTVVDSFADPTWEKVKAIEATLDDGEQLLTPDGGCTAYCRQNCSCQSCLFGCNYCCNPSEGICSGCSTPTPTPTPPPCDPTVEPCPDPGT